MASGLKFLVLLALSGCPVAATTQNPQLLLATKAEQFLRMNDLPSALSILDQASASPSTSDGEDRIGFLYAVSGHPAEAAAHFRKAVAVDRDFAPAHYHLGVLLWLAKDRDEGLPELQSAARLDPKNYDYRFRLGSAYVESGASGKAVPELKASVELNAGKAEAWQELGIAEQQANDLAGAVEAFRKAAEVDPTSEDVRNGYASLLIATRQPKKAIEESQTVLKHNQSNATAYLNMGEAYLKMGEFEKAQQAYQAAVKLEPDSVAAHYNLGIAYKMEDRLDEAEKELEGAIKLEPALAESHYTLGITKWQLGDFSGTIDEMKAAIAIRADYAEAHYMLGIALKQSGDVDAALAELRESIRLDPKTPGPWNTIGQLLRRKGDMEGSAVAFAEGTKLKAEGDKRLSDALEQGMRGGMTLTPMAAPVAKVETH